MESAEARPKLCGDDHRPLCKLRVSAAKQAEEAYRKHKDRSSYRAGADRMRELDLGEGNENHRERLPNTTRMAGERSLTHVNV
jgi:hypothetical protein